MVAKAAWLSVEPRVCLLDYLASEEPKFIAGSESWVPNQGDADEEEFEFRGSGDESLEAE